MQWFLKSKDNNIVKYVRDSTGRGNHSGTNGNQLITGSNNNYKVNNIYDMAGNCWEWTLESYLTFRRVLRGGEYYYTDAEKYSVSYRFGDFPCYGNGSYSSRLTLIM